MDFEEKLQNFYEQFLTPGMSVVDVGAHVGRHGLKMLRLIGIGGHALLCEPLPDLYERLKSIVESEYGNANNVEVVPYALSDEAGISEFCVALDAPAYSGIRERHYDTETRVTRITVELRRLDDLVTEWPRLDYIKIDTEGAEWCVIKGAAGCIQRFRPIVSFEFGENSYAAYGVLPGEVYDFFAAQEYLLFDILGKELNRDSFIESSRHQAVWDYVALPRERELLAGVMRSRA